MQRHTQKNTQPTPHADFPAGFEHFHSYQPKLHLYPSSPTCIPAPPLLSACFISPNPFLLGFIKAFITFHIKRTGEYFPFFFSPMLPIYGRELAQFPISLLFFPDSHITMSLLGLSLPSQWIWSSEDHALEWQRAPAAPTSPHPSLYPCLSAHPSFSLPSMLGLTWRHPDIPGRFFCLGRQPRLWDVASDGEIVIFHLHPSLLLACFVWEMICQQYMWLGSFSS